MNFNLYWYPDSWVRLVVHLILIFWRQKAIKSWSSLRLTLSWRRVNKMGGMHLTTTLSDVSQHCSQADMHQGDRALQRSSLHCSWETVHPYAPQEYLINTQGNTKPNYKVLHNAAFSRGDNTCVVIFVIMRMGVRKALWLPLTYQHFAYQQHRWKQGKGNKENIWIIKNRTSSHVAA